MALPPRPSLANVVREWGRIGCVGFGGPPAHIRLLRQLCVTDRQWISPAEFEDAIAACNLLPGPASTQLAIYCAWRVRGRISAVLGGAAFILPGLILIIGLAALFLESAPPRWVVGAGAGAGAAVAAVAVNAAVDLMGASWGRRRHIFRWLVYLTAGAGAAIWLGPWLVLVLLACGLLEAGLHRIPRTDLKVNGIAVPVMLVASGSSGVFASLGWVAIKVGALAYGGGFVIIPLMRSDVVDRYHWFSGGQFLNAVALGQITPGPVVQTIAVVGYAAAGVLGGVSAALVVFSPSFAFVLFGAHHFDRLRGNSTVRAFLDGAGPAAIGAILGSAVPLALTLSHPWQFAVLAGAMLMLFLAKRGVVLTLLAAGATGALVATLGIAVR